MNWFGFNLLSSAWLFFLIPLLVAFYFLRLKRPRVEIPSLVLWRQVLNDSRVNSPFQRFKRNILLLLQLLLLLLLVLAAMQPFWRGRAVKAKYIPIMIDASASMAARDAGEGLTRLELARREIQTIIDGLLTDQQLCLISFDRTARLLAGFTSNKRELTDALDSLSVTDVGSNIEDALRMVEAMGKTVDFDRVLLYSDGNFPQRSDFELSFELDYQALDPAGPNVGITSLNARRASGGAGLWDVFVSIDASTDQPVAATVEVFHPDMQIKPEHLTVSKDDGERLIYRIAADKPTKLEVRLKPADFDALRSDNIAHLDVTPQRDLWVYCPTELIAYRLALGGIEGLRVWPGEGETETSETEFDLVISNIADDRALAAKVYMFVGHVPESVSEFVGPSGEVATVVDWVRTSSLLEYVELAEVVLTNGPRWLGDQRDAAIEQLGFEAVAYGELGPLILRRRRDEKLYYHVLFDVDESTLPYRLGFPIMVSNLVHIALHETGLAQLAGHQTGVLPPLMLTPNTSYEIKPPRGPARQAQSDDAGRLSGVPALRIGDYEVRGGGQVVAQVGVSLLNEDETRLGRVEQIEFKEHVVGAAQEKAKVDHSFWPHLAVMALIVLFVEWWFYQKRPGGFRR